MSDSKSNDSKKVSVIGIGRLGLCFALTTEKAGYDVVGVDVRASYVKAINDKTFQSDEPNVTEFLKASKNFRATTNLDEAIEHSDVLFIVVATPSTGGEDHYDHSMLGGVLCALNDRKVKGKHIITNCTVIPGYHAKVARYLIRDCVDTTISYNPEFIAQGAIIHGQQYPDMVLIGEGSKAAGDRLEQIYKDMTLNEPSIQRMSVESSEICKLAVNCFCTMKITYANLVGDIADVTPGANKDEILKAVGKDSRVGGKYLGAGYGFGGPCFPRDNRALGGYAEQVGIDALLFKATDKYNKVHTDVMFQQKLKALQEAKQDKVTYTGVAYKYKTTVPIIEESQKLFIAAKLAKAGIKVHIVDYPQIVREVEKYYGDLFTYETRPNPWEK